MCDSLIYYTTISLRNKLDSSPKQVSVSHRRNGKRLKNIDKGGGYRLQQLQKRIATIENKPLPTRCSSHIDIGFGINTTRETMAMAMRLIMTLGWRRGPRSGPFARPVDPSERQVGRAKKEEKKKRHAALMISNNPHHP